MQRQELIRDERSLGDLFSELASETSTLIRQEVALAQVELTNKATMVGKNVGYLVVGGAVGYASLLLILAAVVAILSYLIPLWASALLVGIGVGIAAYVFVSSALAELKKAQLTP